MEPIERVDSPGYPVSHVSSAARTALGRMRALSIEARCPEPRVTTANMLFALSDMARTRMFPKARILHVLHRQLAGHWPELGCERARYICGLAPDLDEPLARTSSSLSKQAKRTLALSALVRGDQRNPLMLEDLVLGLLLYAQSGDDTIAAHVVLRRLGIMPFSILSCWAELAPS